MLRIVEKLNEQFAGNEFNIEKVQAYKEELDNRKLELQTQLSTLSKKLSSDDSSIISQIQQNEKLTENIKEHLLDLEESVGKHEAKVEKLMEISNEYVNKISLLEHARAYLRIFRVMEEISQSIESSLNASERTSVLKFKELGSLSASLQSSNVRETTAVVKFKELGTLSASLQNSKCKYLLRYLDETLRYWHAILKEKYSKQFNEILKTLKWPFAAQNVTPTQIPVQFGGLVENLINIELPTSSEPKGTVSSLAAMNAIPLSLPIALLVRPLKQRFVYHFSGDRKTNQSDKPEWYFTQILAWIRTHQEFIDQHVQPVYDKLKIFHINARIEFARGLVQLAMEKLHWDLPNLALDDHLFSHTVDEALGFDKELRDGYGYPDSQPSVLLVLTEASNFIKWTTLEMKYSLEKLDNIMRSPTAFKQTGEEDEEKTTECVESFVTLLSTLTDRYVSLPEPGHKLQFLYLQQDLLDDFRVRLLQISKDSKEESGDLLSSAVPRILNSIRSLIVTLEEWAITPHFLCLYYHKEQLENPTDESELSPDSSVFSKIIITYSRMQEILLSDLTESIFIEVKARSRDYRKDKWHAMEAFDGLTPSSIPMFHKLTDQLRIMHQVLTPSLRTIALVNLARDLDLFLHEEIVELVYFSVTGCSQFAFDFQRNLVPLFGQYIKKPEAHFRLLVDSCTVLTLTKGSALLLQTALKHPQEDDPSTSDVLKDVHIHTLKKNQVLHILERRLDLIEIQNKRFH